jgi:hypothetical protein
MKEWGQLTPVLWSLGASVRPAPHAKAAKAPKTGPGNGPLGVPGVPPACRDIRRES